MDASTPATLSALSAALPWHRPAAAPVLIVDDDDPIRETLRMLLEAEGYFVVESDTIVAASRYLRAATNGHVVLLDWLMARGGNGGVLLREVEQDTALRRHCYVLLTAAAPSQISDGEQRLIDARCAEIVSKPFDLAVLFDAVTRAEAQLHP